MSFLKGLGWAAAGVAAIVAAPVTGGASLAAIIGGAGTTTAAGAAIGAMGGLAAKGIYDAATDDSPDLVSHYRAEAETNRAALTESERRRKEDAELSKAEVSKLHKTVADILKDNELMLDELRKRPFTRQESELMFTIAAAIAHADGNTAQEEVDAAVKAVSLLCAEPEGVAAMGAEFFKNPLGIEEARQKIYACGTRHSLERLEFVLDMVAFADEAVTPAEQQLLDAVSQQARLVDQGL